MSTITKDDMFVYDFGERRVWPKPELKEPFDVLSWHSSIVSGLSRLEQFAHVNGRSDHFIKDLDTLASALKETLYRVMVLREAITGFQSKTIADLHFQQEKFREQQHL